MNKENTQVFNEVLAKCENIVNKKTTQYLLDHLMVSNIDLVKQVEDALANHKPSIEQLVEAYINPPKKKSEPVIDNSGLPLVDLNLDPVDLVYKNSLFRLSKLKTTKSTEYLISLFNDAKSKNTDIDSQLILALKEHGVEIKEHYDDDPKLLNLLYNEFISGDSENSRLLKNIFSERSSRKSIKSFINHPEMNEFLKFSFLIFAAEKNYNTPKRKLHRISNALYQILINDNSGKTLNFLKKYTDDIEQTNFQLSDVLIEILLLVGKSDMLFLEYLNKKLTSIDNSNYYLKKISLNTRFFNLVFKIGFTETGITSLKDFVEINRVF